MIDEELLSKVLKEVDEFTTISVMGTVRSDNRLPNSKLKKIYFVSIRFKSKVQQFECLEKAHQWILDNKDMS